MTPEQNQPPTERGGIPIRLTAPQLIPARRPRGRPGRLTRRTTVLTVALVAALIAGGALFAEHNATQVAHAAAPAYGAAQVTQPTAALSTPAMAARSPAAPATATAVPTTATAGQVTKTPAPAATPQQVATGGIGTQPVASVVPTVDTIRAPAATATRTASPTPSATAQPVQATPAQAIIAAFPSVTQWYHLDCEYAAAAAVTLYWGHLVSQSAFVRAVPSSPNPHLGFRGNVNGAFGGLANYGVYAEALVPVLAQYGYNATPFYGDTARLKAAIAAGNPVVVWISTGKYVRPTAVLASYHGATFKLVTGEHAVVVYGYDSGGVYIMDVSNGRFVYTAWGSFLTEWGYFDQMALTITPHQTLAAN